MKTVRDDSLGVLRVLMCLVGIVLLSVGCYRWWEPAGLIAPGVVLIIMAVAGEVASARASRADIVTVPPE